MWIKPALWPFLLARHASALRIILLQHANEAQRGTTSTWPLLQPHCEVKVMTWSGRDDNDELERQLSSQGVTSLVWPSSSGSTVNAGDRDQTFIVLDGTWTEAEKIYRKGPPLLRSMPHSSLVPQKPSIYKLRKNFGFVQKFEEQGVGKGNLLCTAEVGAELLRAYGQDSAASSILAALEAVQSVQSGSRPIQPMVDDDAAGKSVVYLLRTNDGRRTYVGATKLIKLDRRLRQHNGELAGGARATRQYQGEWQRVCHIQGFDDWPGALQFEWSWKNLSRRATGKSPVERRKNALEQLLTKDRATKQAKAFAEWKSKPEIIWEEL